MRVKDLINLLKNCNPDSDVLLESTKTDYSSNIVLEIGDLEDWSILLKEADR